MIDQYERGLKSQTLTRDAALELIQNFFVMLSVVERIRSWEDTAFSGANPFFKISPLEGPIPALDWMPPMR